VTARRKEKSMSVELGDFVQSRHGKGPKGRVVGLILPAGETSGMLGVLVQTVNEEGLSKLVRMDIDEVEVISTRQRTC